MLFRGGLRDCEDCDLEFELELADEVGEGVWLDLKAIDALVGPGVDIMSEGECVTSVEVMSVEPDDSILIASIVIYCMKSQCQQYGTDVCISRLLFGSGYQ